MRPRGDKAGTVESPGVDACAFVFDVLHAGAIDEDDARGIRTHDLSLRERRARLSRALPGLGRHPGRFELATSREIRGVAGGDATVNADAVEDVSAIVLESIDAACEGVMLKRLDGPGSAYAPSARADAWLKLKRDYVAELRDSLDLVPIGAWRGVGRKAGWFSPFLLAVYDPETETYASMCRCMSGFTDAFYVDRTARFGADADAATPKTSLLRAPRDPRCVVPPDGDVGDSRRGPDAVAETSRGGGGETRRARNQSQIPAVHRRARG